MLVCTLHGNPRGLPVPNDDKEVAGFHYLQLQGGRIQSARITLPSQRIVWLDAYCHVEDRFARYVNATVSFVWLSAILRQSEASTFDVYDLDCGKSGVAIHDGARLWTLAPDVTVYEADQLTPAEPWLAILADVRETNRVKVVDDFTLLIAHPTRGNWRYRVYDTLLLVDAMTPNAKGERWQAFAPKAAALDFPLTTNVRHLLPAVEREPTYA